MSVLLDTETLIAGLSSLSDQLEESDDPELLAQMIVRVRRLVAELREFAATVERRYAEIAPKAAEFAGIGLVEVKRETKRTAWQHDEILKRIVAMARDERAFDETTGEALEDEFSCLARVLSECARFEWRVTPLRARGLDPDEFCHTEYGKPAVKVA